MHDLDERRRVVPGVRAPGVHFGAGRADWPFAGRRDELSALESILAQQTRGGVLFVGAAGVGKTRLATEGLALAARHGFAPASARATKTARSIPFGAVATLLPASPLLRGVDNRAAMIRRMSQALVAESAPKRVALLVDDAHLLDDASATLVHQLVTSGAAFVLMTARAEEPLPDAVLSLWKDSSAERVAVKGLTVDAAEHVLSVALGAPVDRGTVGRLVEHTRGNIMFIRELVLGAIEDGSLANEGGLWCQVRPLSPSERLVELVEARLAGLTADQRSVLELLAVGGEPMGRRELQVVADARRLEELERAGLLVSSVSRRRLQMRLAHPLYGDVLRASMPAVGALSVTRSLAEATEDTGARRREDTLRIATWRLRCGGASPSLMFEAAQKARWSYDFELAARLAGAAVDAGAGFAAKLFASQVETLRGHSADVVGDLSQLAEEATSDAARATVALVQLDNLAFNLAQIDDALALAVATEERIGDPDWKDEIAAKRASLLLVDPAGGPGAAADAAEPLLLRARGSAKVWSCFTASCSLTRLGRMQEALHWADEGRSEHLRLDRQLDWDTWIHDYSRGEALAQLGSFDEADALTLARYEEGIAAGSVERQAFFAWQLGTRAGERGGVRSAIQRCREAAGLYGQMGRPFFVRHCLVHLSLALALADQPEEASNTLARLDEMELPAKLFAYSGDLLQARAWTAAADGDLARAHAFLEEGLAFGEGTGDLIGQATALHGLARLGQSRRVAPALTALAAKIDGELFSVRAAHATALARGHAERLRAASAGFEAMGALLLAAEAAADEAAVHERAGEDRKAAVAERRARTLAADCEGAVTPSLRRLGGPAALTGAERRVARLAGSGRSNREIAEAHCVSVRTVEHQLQSVYGKLGISGRKELAEALAAVDGAKGAGRVGV